MMNKCIFVVTLCTYAQQGYAFGHVGLCTYVYVYLLTKNTLFSALLLENLLLSVMCCLLFEFKRLQCGFLRPASCTDRAIHAFPIRCGGPLAPNIFFWALTAHHMHPLNQFLCYNSFNVMHIYIYITLCIYILCIIQCYALCIYRLARAVHASNYSLGTCCTCSTLN